MDVAASNPANAETTRPPPRPYRAESVVFSALTLNETGRLAWRHDDRHSRRFVRAYDPATRRPTRRSSRTPNVDVARDGRLGRGPLLPEINATVAQPPAER